MLALRCRAMSKYHLKPFGKTPKFNKKWTPPDAKWLKFHVGATLPRNVKINLAGRPLTPARFFDLAYSEGRGSWNWKTGPAWTVIQVAAAFSPRLDFTFDTFQSFPFVFHRLSFLCLSLCGYVGILRFGILLLSVSISFVPSPEFVP